MKKGKLTALFLVVAIVAGLFAACSPNSSPTDSQGGSAPNPSDSQGGSAPNPGDPSAPPAYDPDDTTPASLTFCTWWGGGVFKTLKAVIDEFVADNPHITVDPLLWPYGQDYEQKLIVATAADQQPDLITLTESNFPKFWFGGILEPLDFYLDAIDYDTGRWLPGVKELHTLDGQIVAMPLYRAQRVTWYNADLFREAGLPDLPQQPTWDDIEHAARTISEMGTNAAGKQVYGVRIHQDYWSCLGVYLNDLGLPLEGDANSAKFYTPERVAAGKRLFDMMINYGPATGLTFEPMLTGVLGMDIGQPSGFVNEAGREVRFETRMVNFPVGDASQGQFVAVHCNSLSMGNQSKYKPAATKLLAALTSPEAEEKMKSYVLTPSSGAVYDELLAPKDTFPFNSFQVLDPKPGARFNVWPAFDWVSRASASFEAVINGDMSVEDYFLEGQENIDSYLANPGRNPLAGDED
ncbi:MAG: extracellular solute-binding protein [Oscillospiraceae bacterium]|jgi:ABC-type glycerol-3-phosphate transport system substrate-binding protein|nr:extracellular solute-binding protein [Oscillospiraceae bacterium]